MYVMYPPPSILHSLPPSRPLIPGVQLTFYLPRSGNRSVSVVVALTAPAMPIPCPHSPLLKAAMV